MNILGPQNLTQQAYSLVKTIQSQSGGLYYWLVDDEHSASVINHNLRLFADILYPDLNSSVVDPSRGDFTIALKKILARDNGVYVLTVHTYQLLDKALSLYSENIFSIEKGDTLNPVKLKKKLISLGYSDTDDDELYFSGKGELINIHQGEDFYRIVFDIDKIDSITDHNKEGVDELELMSNELDLSSLPIEEVNHPKGIIVASDQLAFKNRNQSEIWYFRSFKSEIDQEKEVAQFKLGEVKKYRRDFEKMKKDLGGYKDYQIILGAVDTDVLQTAVGAQKFDPRIVAQVALAEGFVDEENKFLFLSHADIFGRKEVKERKRRDDSVFLTKLMVNDYIVHEDHGIGRYLGLVQTEIEGHKRENLLLEYSHKDKLYVPVELAYKVDKYIGEAKPKLQRLSGTTWIKMARKASHDSQKFARDLLKLYAKRSLVQVPVWTIFPDADEKLHQSFGYTETVDQEQAIQDVYQDLQKNEPMDRLVVGDVGFGKTEVAIRAAYQAVLNHKQVAVLCPTTLLAQQHYDTFKARLESLGAKVEMLSRLTGKVGSEKKSVKKIVEQLKTGEVDIVIGTHRLLSKDIDFHNIGLVIVDEEQRFGVRHKERLKQIRSQSHILTLSATPIPRTLYFSLSGLRNISTIQTPPEGRQPINTQINRYSEDIIKKSIKKELKRGGQAFYLYNRVQTIQTAKKRLQGLLGSKVKIDIVHGQMPPREMARVAHDFGVGKIDVLVCTTIVENGLDLPNVNTLIVHNATRFGIGQLYQIRGRIGRGSVEAHAFFLYPEEGLSGVAARRLQILEEAKELGSGFQLAMRDLEMRGMGDMLGKKQHGNIQKVGLTLYGKLLRQAVEEIETGEIQYVKPTVNINLPLDYGIPESLVADPEERVRLYRQISDSSSIQEVNSLVEEYGLNEKTNEPDQNLLNNLLHILELRFLAEKSPLTSIDYQEVEGIDGRKRKQVEITFDTIKPKYIDLLYTVLSDFKIAGDRIAFNGENIDDFYKDIKKIIMLFDS